MQTATVRLIRPSTPRSRTTAAAADETYCPLVIGCIRLLRPASGSGEWRVPVLPNGKVWPVAWAVAGSVQLSLRSGGCRRTSHFGGSAHGPVGSATARLTLGLLCGADLQPPLQGQPAVQLQTCVADIYGWSLLYQPQRLGGGLAAVDAHPDIPELPAFYESPLELCDRLDFLDRRGVPARPLALVTRPEDFVADAAQQPGRLPRRNRFIKGSHFRPPADLSRLPGG